jgi:hypothetical protein
VQNIENHDLDCMHPQMMRPEALAAIGAHLNHRLGQAEPVS